MFSKKIVALIDINDFDDPVQRAAACEDEGADGVLFACEQGGAELVSAVRRAAELLEIPIAAECANFSEAEEILDAGAAKAVLGDAAVRNPSLISEAAAAFGSGKVVVAVRAQRKGAGYWEVCTEGGARPERMDAYCFAIAAARLGAGELLLVSLERGGRVSACDADFVTLIASAAGLPVSVVCSTEDGRDLCTLTAGGMAASVVSSALIGGRACALSLKRSISAANFSAYGEAALELRLGA